MGTSNTRYFDESEYVGNLPNRGQSFVGKYAKIGYVAPQSYYKSTYVIANTCGILNIFIYEDINHINPINTFSTYCGCDINVVNENNINKITEISFEDLTTTSPGYIWGVYYNEKYRLNIKMEGCDIISIVTSLPFRLFEGYDELLICSNCPTDYTDTDHNY